jgi:hypothetical protein
MKTLFLALSFGLLIPEQIFANTVVLWSFESPNVPPTVTSSSVTGLLPEFGAGSASGVHASTATAFSSPVGNGSAHSFNADRWVAGDYWQFHLSTIGFKDIQLSFDQSATATGPTNFDLLFSTDGTAFTTFLSHYTVLQNSTGNGGGGGVWNSSTAFTSYTRTVDLSSVSVLNEAPDIYIRLRNTLGSPGSTSGTGRIDNFLVSAVPVPEPRAASLCLIAGFVSFWLRQVARRRRLLGQLPC